MIENIVISEQLIPAKEKNSDFDRKFGSYDHLASGELTVTITLAEYRSLLQSTAEQKAHEAVLGRLDAERKVNDLQKVLEAVRKQMADLKAMFTRAALEAVTNKKEELSNG